jgi:hypothetical protein
MRGLKGPQEIGEVLLIAGLHSAESRDHRIRLRPGACVGGDGDDDVRRAAVVEEEEALPYAPEGRASELIRPGCALGDAIRQSAAHAVKREIREWVKRHIT